MRPGLLAQVRARLLTAIPVATIAASVLLGAMPWPVPGVALVAPGVTLAAVYFWSVWRPDLLPAPGLLLIGLLEDCLAGTPFGLNALLLLATQGLTRSQRRYLAGKSFVMAWAGILMIAPAVAILGWAAGGIALGAMLPVAPLALQAALQVVLFPVLAALLLPALRYGLRAA